MAFKNSSVSIALATYNGEKYLHDQIDSLINQSLLPNELVITDDGSSDQTVKIIERYASCAPFPINLVRNEQRLGYRANFMKAASLCSSELIFFCDQDDVWRTNKIQKMVSAFEDDGILLVYHNANLINAIGDNIGILYSSDEQFKLMATFPLAPWHFSQGFTQGFRRTLLEFNELWPLSKHHFYEQNMAHDQWFFFLALAFGGAFYLKETLVDYRQHDNNVFGATKRRSVLSQFKKMVAYRATGNLQTAEAADSRANIIRSILQAGSLNKRERLCLIIDEYLQLSKCLRIRYDCYHANNMLKRFKAFTELIQNSAYGGGAWGFEPVTMPRDIIAGVLLSPLFKKPAIR